MTERHDRTHAIPAVSRRTLLQAGAAAGAGLAGGLDVAEAAPGLPPTPLPELSPPLPPMLMLPVSLTVNGQRQALVVDARTTLLDLLREHLHLTGSKKGCDHGQCGACTVLADGERINACLSLAVMHEGGEVTTIEGLAPDAAAGGPLHPMQAAFLEHDGYQCGYCTPGQICSAVGMLREQAQGQPSWATADVADPHPALTDAELRERMSGNICRCSAYPNIAAAIRHVHDQDAGQGKIPA